MGIRVGIRNTGLDGVHIEVHIATFSGLSKDNLLHFEI